MFILNIFYAKLFQKDERGSHHRPTKKPSRHDSKHGVHRKPSRHKSADKQKSDTHTDKSEKSEPKPAKTEEDIGPQPSVYSYEEVDNYEQAINVVGFGKFNILVFLLLIPMEFAMQFQMYGMSYAMLQVECDLQLGSIWKGLLITTNLIGMIPSGLPWMLIADVYGRRKVILFGMIAHTILKIGEVFAWHFYVLVVCEFLGGFIICGPYAVFIGAVYDFHSQKYRRRILFIYTIIICVTNNIIGLTALLVMSENYEIGGVLYEWNVFMMIAILPSLLTVIGVFKLPESPKYLLRASQDEDALKVLKYIGHLNKADQRLSSEKPYPAIKIPPNYKAMFRKTKLEIRSLKPWISLLAIGCFLQGFSMSGEITLRIWLPVMFATTADAAHRDGEETGICYMLDFGLLWRRESCNIHMDFQQSFLYTLIVSLIVDLCILIVAVFTKFKKRVNVLMIPFYLVAAIVVCCVFFLSSVIPFMILIALYLLIMTGLNIVVITVIYEAFPPNMRLSMAYQFALTIGRVLVVIFAVAFSFLYNVACIAPFALLAACAIFGGITSLFIPRKREMYG